jgi:hypothetical protein
MNLRKRTFLIRTISVVLLLCGCGLGGGPRARWGFTPKEKHGDPANLGTHSYGPGGSETSGVIYTLRAGSIDPDHLRGVADLTRYTYDKAYETLINAKSGFRAGPAFEMTTNKIYLQYPDNWNQLPQTEKQKIAHRAALIIAPVVSYHSSIWHEMLTWKGLHFALIEPEHESSFSWEDLYSNALGAKLAVEALQNGRLSTQEYNQAMTRLIRKELDQLQVVPKERAIEIFESARGTWFTSDRLMKRNMDIGYDDGLITPCLIPGFTDEEPVSLPLPTFDGLQEYGIRVTYTISSAYLQNGTLKQMAGVNSDVEPIKHFPIIMKKIEQEAIRKYNYQIR